MLRRCTWLIPLVLLLALTQPVLGASPQVSAEIDPRVLVDLASGSAPILIRLRSAFSQPRIQTAESLLIDPTTQQIHTLQQVASDSQSGLVQDLQLAGYSLRTFWVVNAISLTAGPDLLAQLAARPDVFMLESDRPFQVSLETSAAVLDSQAATGIQPGLSLVKAPTLWALGFQGKGMVVASADTGVEWQHPALRPHYRGWNGTTADHNANWWDAIHQPVNPSFTSNPCGYSSPVPCDDYGHGTHTVGTMVGDDGNGNQIGMAPAAQWIGCRNMDAGWGSPSTYIECLQFFIAPTDLAGKNPNPALRPHVIDNSYSCPPTEGCSTTSLHDAVQAVRAAGIFMSVSAGNEGRSGCNTITSPPAIEPGVFTVGGIDASTGQVFTGSSRGPVTAHGGQILKPDLIAPGVNVISSTRGSGYGAMTGTSMAAPHVAGAVALLWNARSELARKIQDTEFILRFSAERYPVNETCGGLPAQAVPNNTTGWGVLNVLAAYHQPVPLWTYFPIIQQSLP